MVTSSLIDRLSRALDQIEQQSKNRSLKIVRVRRSFDEEPDVARERHFAAHPEDRDANIIIFKFCDDKAGAEHPVGAI